MNSSPTLNDLLSVESLECHARVITKTPKNGVLRSVQCSEYFKIKKKKQTKEAAQPEESGYDTENRSTHTTLVSSL